MLQYALKIYTKVSQTLQNYEQNVSNMTEHSLLALTSMFFFIYRR